MNGQEDKIVSDRVPEATGTDARAAAYLATLQNHRR